jgi:predicted nucleic acid-binding Zn ribbon protein
VGKLPGYHDRDRRHPPPPGPRRVSSFLVDAARDLGVEGAVKVAALSSRWAEIVGQAVADHTFPRTVREGVLDVVADHHAWAAQLRLLSAELVRKVQVVSPDVVAINVHVSPSGQSRLVK